MTCRLETICPEKDVCEIAEAVQGNPCNPYIIKADTPPDYLPGEEPPVGDLRFWQFFNPIHVLTCAAGQTITIKE
jgi:hypothetical protein